jgi:hypothetical protein
MNRLNNGTQYRATPTGYLLRRGKRSIYINAKSVNAGDKARDLMANKSFNQLFLQAHPVHLLGANARAIKLD